MGLRHLSGPVGERGIADLVARPDLFEAAAVELALQPPPAIDNFVSWIWAQDYCDWSFDAPLSLDDAKSLLLSRLRSPAALTREVAVLSCRSWTESERTVDLLRTVLAFGPSAIGEAS